MPPAARATENRAGHAPGLAVPAAVHPDREAPNPPEPALLHREPPRHHRVLDRPARVQVPGELPPHARVGKEPGREPRQVHARERDPSRQRAARPHAPLHGEPLRRVGELEPVHRGPPEVDRRRAHQPPARPGVRQGEAPDLDPVSDPVEHPPRVERDGLAPGGGDGGRDRDGALAAGEAGAERDLAGPLHRAAPQRRDPALDVAGGVGARSRRTHQEVHPVDRDLSRPQRRRVEPPRDGGRLRGPGERRLEPRAAPEPRRRRPCEERPVPGREREVGGVEGRGPGDRPAAAPPAPRLDRRAGDRGGEPLELVGPTRAPERDLGAGELATPEARARDGQGEPRAQVVDGGARGGAVPGEGHGSDRERRGEARRVEPLEGDVEARRAAEGALPDRHRGVAAAARARGVHRLEPEGGAQRDAVGLGEPGRGEVGPERHLRDEGSGLLARDSEPRQRHPPGAPREVALGNRRERRPARADPEDRDPDRVTGPRAEELDRDRRRDGRPELPGRLQLRPRPPRPGRAPGDEVDPGRLDPGGPGRVLPPEVAAAQREPRDVDRPAAEVGAATPAPAPLRDARGAGGREGAGERGAAVRLLLHEDRRLVELEGDSHRARPELRDVHREERPTHREDEVVVGVVHLEAEELDVPLGEEAHALELEPARDRLVHEVDRRRGDEGTRERRGREEGDGREREAGEGEGAEEGPAEPREDAGEEAH